MPYFQATAQRKPYYPKANAKINAFQVGMNVLGRLFVMGVQGGLVAMLCYVGLGFFQGIFGHALIGMLPALSVIAPFLLIPFGLAAVTFLYSMSNDFGKPKRANIAADQESQNEDETFLSFGLSWVLPMALFAISLNTGYGLSAASWVAFSVAAVGSAFWTLVKPTLEYFALLQFQNQLIASQQLEAQQANDELQPKAQLPAKQFDPKPKGQPQKDSPSKAQSSSVLPLFNSVRSGATPPALTWQNEPNVVIHPDDNHLDISPPSSPSR